jgi:LacI family transcriptional regulator
MTEKTKTSDSQKILISIRSLRRASARDVISGIFNHLERTSDCNICLMQSVENPITTEKIRNAEKSNVAGLFISKAEDAELMRALVDTPIPIAVIGIKAPVLKARKNPTVFIFNDNAGIGTMGADYFLKHGKFNSFGFVCANNDVNSMAERAEAFCNRIRSVAPDTFVSVFPPVSDPGSEKDIAALSDWILTLPKPAAIMAIADWRAAHVLTACDHLKIRVPEAVSVLGVDNDEFMCAHASPPLSSILPNHVEIGRRAAEELEKLIKGKNNGRRKEITVPPQMVIERESTRICAPSAALVDRTKRFIRANATRGITVADVVDHLKVSRRLAEIRYRAATGETIREAIESAKMAKLKRLLISNRRPISAIAAECGFSNINSLSHRFQQCFGSSMREFRKNATNPG